MTLHTPPTIAGVRQVSDRTPHEHVWLAIILVAFVGLRLRLPLGAPPGFLVGMALLPVTLTALPRARRLAPFGVLCLAAAAAGAVLTMVHSGEASWDLRNLLVGMIRLLSVPVAVLSLVWARTVIGTAAVVRVFALASLFSLLFVGVNPDNLWKFSFAVPITLLSLSLPGVYGHRGRESVVIIALTVVSVLNDSRSAAAVLLIATALVLAQRSPRSTPLRVGTVLAQIGATVLAGYYAVQALILEGVLGEAARARTEMQIEQSGSLLLGGRPEIGASVALLSDSPLGVGPGTLVTYEKLQVAKTGMAQLNYDPNNRYVESYMFGNGYEVHSVIGDLWLWFGPLGLVVSGVIAWVLIRGMASAIGSGAATGVMLYLALRSLWDLPFAPFPSALLTLALALALCWPLREERSGRARLERPDASRRVWRLGGQGGSPSRRVSLSA